ASATPLSGCGSTPAAIDCVGDLDYYWLTAPGSGSFTFETTGTTDTELRLYDSNGDAIASDDDGGSGTNARIVYSLAAGQKYSVAVNEHNNDGAGDYTLVISGCSSGGCGNDPGNDDLNSATPISGCATPTQSAIDCVGDLDFYSFVAPSSGDYTFQTTTTDNTDTQLVLYDAGGGIIAADDNSGNGSNAWLQHALTGGQTYTIQVNEAGNDGTGSYSLSIDGCSSSCGNDPGNDDIGHATDLGSSCTSRAANIDCAADHDVYKFIVPSDGIYTYSATGAKDTYVRLMDATGNVIKMTGNSVTNTETAGSVRYFQVDPISTLDAPFAYTLEISGCSSGGCGTDPGNDDRDHATNIGTGVGTWPAAIDCPGDSDVYTFTAPQTANYTIMTTGSTDTWIQIADSAVIGSDDNSGQDTNASLTADLTAGTRYYVTVKEASGSGTGNYELAIAGSQSGAVFTYIVPATAKITGLSGTDWRSDLSIVNTKWSATLITIEAWMRDQANPNPVAVTRVIGGGEAFNKTDLLASLFGFGSGSSAALKITSDNELAVSTRTYNLTSNGTYGQYIRGRDLAASFQVGETAYLQGFREDSQARSNLGLVNVADVTNTITVTFFAADGSQLGSPQTYAVPAHGFIQRTRVLREVTSNPVELAWARLTAANGPFVGYLSLIDAASGDPTFRPTMAASTESSEVILPGIAKVHGASSTNWVSNMVLLNTTASARQVSIELWVRDDANGSPQSRTLTLAARECRRLEDVLPGLFGMSKGAAAFRITAGSGVIVDARTFNQVSSGSYGQYVPSMYRIQGILSAQPGVFPMVTQNTDYRTNLGLVNGDSGAVDVMISLLDESGTVIGAPITVQLADRAVTQIDRIVERFTGDPFSGGYLKLEVPSSFPDHPVHAFLTVVDQKTGDPVYLTPAAIKP
ncbi:MAG: hypothetical protein GXP47_08600, partial [Acidobacteria bacterium]|nr:hypothetical protein [Acidobacteriota bacterium]